MEQFRLSNNHGSYQWGKMIYPYDLIKLLHDFIFVNMSRKTLDQNVMKKKKLTLVTLFEL